MIATQGPMSVGLKWNLQTFNETLRRAVQESSRAAPKVINGHALGVAAKAIELTEKANAAQIATTLGQTGTQLNYTKRGKLSKSRKGVTRRRILAEDSFAARIVNARRRDFAGPDYMLWGTALEAAAKKLITARMRSVAFIKSGWIWALRELSAIVGKRPWRDRGENIAVTKTRKGGAIPALPGANVKAIIYNTALVQAGGKFQSRGTHNPWPIAEKGLRAALRAEEANMREHINKGIFEALRRAQAA